MHAQSIIASHPDAEGNVNAVLLEAIEACLDCAQAYTACADACLVEKGVADSKQCIRLDLDGADLCGCAT